MNTRLCALTALLTMALLALPFDARAQGDTDIDAADMELAGKAYQDGMRAYRDQEYERAIQALRLSYTIVANPMILYNIAIIEVDARRYDDALITMTQATDAGLPPEEDAKNSARARAVGALLLAQRAAPRIKRAHAITFSDAPADSPDLKKPLWPPLLCMAAGGGAFIAAATIDFRIIEARQTLDDYAAQGDGPAYTAQVETIETLQRRGRIALATGSVLTLTGLTWTLLRLRKNAQSAPSTQESTLRIMPWLGTERAGAALFTRF